jgi:hypothetical protein
MLCSIEWDGKVGMNAEKVGDGRSLFQSDVLIYQGYPQRGSLSVDSRKIPLIMFGTKC